VLRGEDLQALSDDPDDLMADLQALAVQRGSERRLALHRRIQRGELPPRNRFVKYVLTQSVLAGIRQARFRPHRDLHQAGHRSLSRQRPLQLCNDFWNSRNPYSTQKAPLLLNELEGDTSGPIGKRASFTVDAQRNMVDNGAIINAVT